MSMAAGPRWSGRFDGAHGPSLERKANCSKSSIHKRENQQLMASWLLNSLFRSSRSTLRKVSRSALIGILLSALAVSAAEHALVLHTDFGLKDGAVGAMRGVAATVSLRIPIHDLSHENTPFNIWEAAYRLKQAAGYWPEGTVFVSVIDPGVGGERK